MNRTYRDSSSTGWTLVEMMVALAVSSILFAGIAMLGYTSRLLTAKALSLNVTGNVSRNSMDRITEMIELSNNTPTLVSATATLISGTATANTAPGIVFDQYIDGPYVVTAGNGTSITMSYDATALTPFPNPPAKAYDAVIINTTILLSSGSLQLRAPISNVAISGSQLTITSGTNLGTFMPSSGTVIAYVVRPTAFAIRQNSSTGYTELRLYNSQAASDILAGTGLTDLDNPQKYIVLTDGIYPYATGTDASVLQSGFSLTTSQNRTFVNLSLRVRDRDYDNYLAKRQFNSFDAFSQLDSTIALKGIYN